MDLGKRNLLGVLVDAVDYDGSVARIIEAAEQQKPYAVSALAVHGVMEGVRDASHRHRLNDMDLITPDGQPVRWALNLLHRTRLSSRVYGPTLTLLVCAEAAARNLPICLYGSRVQVLRRLTRNLTMRFPGLSVAHTQPSVFRSTTLEEKRVAAERIRESGARITFVGLGCPRQEIFVHEYKHLLGMPVVAVGAAFDYHAGLLVQPPEWVQRAGMQWLLRLCEDPTRLWRRYVLLNPLFVAGVLAQGLRLWRPDPGATTPPIDVNVG